MAPHQRAHIITSLDRPEHGAPFVQKGLDFLLKQSVYLVAGERRMACPRASAPARACALAKKGLAFGSEKSVCGPAGVKRGG
jgi:hypothetical protein